MAKNYIYQGKNAAQYSNIPIYESSESPYFTCVNEGIVLPAKHDRRLPWGKGGVLGADGTFIEESRLDDSFGAPYEYEMDDVEQVDEEVIYLGILPRHWGHVLIDVLCKLWSPMIQEHRYRIVFCGLDWQEHGVIDGVYSQLLELAGICKDDLIYVTKPTRFTKILIPSRTLGFERSWNASYRDVISRIVNHAEKQASQRGLASFEKLYLSRTNFAVARKSEVGEDKIEQLFADNGYKVVFPETLDAVEQIHLYHNCSEFVSLSGTLAHNLVFSQPGVRAVILNRTWAMNPPQIRINQVMGINPTYVDVYDERELKRKSGYRAGDYAVHLLTVNPNLRHWCRDNDLMTPIVGHDLDVHLRYEELRFLQSLRRIKHRIASLRSQG